MSASRITTVLFIVLSGLTIVLSLVTAGQCALGKGSDSITSDIKTLGAVKKAATSRIGYTVHELESDSGRVREYLSSGGVVFAVAWDGFAPPDLTKLLGEYDGEYRTALATTVRKRGVRRQQVVSDRLVVQRWGHMRNLRGRAYVPELMPAGVTSDDIK